MQSNTTSVLRAAIWFLATTLFASSLGGCRAHGAASSQVKIVNGVASADFPAVVGLRSRRVGEPARTCTGTFIAPTILLTALHCIADGETGTGLDVEVTGAPGMLPAKRFFDSAYLSRLRQKVVAPDRDFAVLVFEPKVAADLGIVDFPRVRSVPLAVGDAITMVGMGAKAIGGPALGARSQGTNLVSATDGRVVTITGVAHGGADQMPGKSVSLAGGDSGGPLLDAEGLIAGVASFEEWDLKRNQVISQYFALTSDVASGVFEQAGILGPDGPGT